MNSDPPPTCTYLLFTAVSSERKTLYKVADDLKIPYQKRKSNVGKYLDLGTIGRSRVLAIHTKMGPFTSNGSAAKALQWRGLTQASAIIGIGMAFGTMPQKQKHGDIMVATALLPYDQRVIRCGSAQSPVVDYSEVPTFPARPQLLALFELAARLDAWRGQVHLGPFLSGAARIHCSTYRDELQRAFLDRGLAVGGDMEGIGLLASSDETESRWIIVKGISDFADEERDTIIESMRPTACYNAIKFVLCSLKDEETILAESRRPL